VVIDKWNLLSFGIGGIKLEFLLDTDITSDVDTRAEYKKVADL